MAIRKLIMNNYEKLFKNLSHLIENGILTSKDIKKELSNNCIKRDRIINDLELVNRKEFEVLKKLVQKQELTIKKLLKKKKLKR